LFSVKVILDNEDPPHTAIVAPKFGQQSLDVHDPDGNEVEVIAPAH